MEVVMEQQQIDVPGSWTCLHCNHVNDGKRKQCGGRKREDNTKFCRRWNPLATRRRRTAPPEANTVNITNSTALTNSVLIQNQTVSTPSQMPSNTANEIRIERTAVIGNTALRIAPSARALQCDAHTVETTETELEPNLCSECKVTPTNHHCSICKKVLVCATCKIKRGHEDLNPHPCVNCDDNAQNKPNTYNANETNEALDSNNTEPPAAKKAKVVVNEIDTSAVNDDDSSSSDSSDDDDNINQQFSTQPFCDASTMTPNANMLALPQNVQPSPIIAKNLTCLDREKIVMDKSTLMQDALEEELEHPGGDSDVENETSLANVFSTALNVDEHDFDNAEEEEDQTLVGSPDNWQPPTAPPDWEHRMRANEPSFNTVDNPGNWSNYVYRAKFDKKGRCKFHSQSTGVIPVSKNADGQRKIEDWYFFYQGWKSDPNKKIRHKERSDYVNKPGKYQIPEERKGRLSAEQLRKYGITKDRVKECDALFFRQLILPLCDTSLSGIENDERKNFYCECEIDSNTHASKIRAISSYGHAFEPITISDLAHFDGVITRDGCIGGGIVIFTEDG